MPTSKIDSAPTNSLKGYWIVLAKVTDPSRFGAYTAMAGPIIQSCGGRVLARGDVAEVVEGEFPGRPYLIEFPSYASAQTCYQSAGYQEAIGLRTGAAEFQIVIVEGFQLQTQ